MLPLEIKDAQLAELAKETLIELGIALQPGVATQAAELQALRNWRKTVVIVENRRVVMG